MRLLKRGTFSQLMQESGGIQRRGGDSNPRWTERPIPVFETGSFNRSATSPVEPQRLARAPRPDRLGLGLAPSGSKEGPQQVGRLPGQEAALDLGPMVEPGL